MINLDCSLLIVQSSGRAKWAECFFEAALGWFFSLKNINLGAHIFLMTFFDNNNF